MGSSSTIECEVKLIGGLRSPFVARAMIALKLKNVEFKLLDEKLGKKSEILLKSNPVHKMMPVLLHHGKPICESLLIVQYIDEVWSSMAPAILPCDPYDRAIACFWASYIDRKWMLSLNEVLVSNIKEEEINQDALKQVEEGLFLLEDAYNKINKGKLFFSGQDWIGFLDIALGSFLYRIKVLEIMNDLSMLNESKTPGLARWSDKFLDDPVVKSVLVGVDETMELFKLIGKMMSPDSVATASDDSVTSIAITMNDTATSATVATAVAIVDLSVDNACPVGNTSTASTVVTSDANSRTVVNDASVETAGIVGG